MISLIAAGSPGGDGSEVRFTVPWCETVARLSRAEVSGRFMGEMQAFCGYFRSVRHKFESHGECLSSFRREQDLLYLRMLTEERLESRAKFLEFVVFMKACFTLGDELGMFEEENLCRRRTRS